MHYETVWHPNVLLSLGVVALLGSAVACDSSATADPIEGTAQSASLRLSLATGATNYVAGVPITVYAQLTNPNPRPVQAHGGYGWFNRAGTRAFWLGYLTLALHRNATDWQYRPPGMWLLNMPSPDPMLVGPGTHMRTKDLLTAHGGAEEYIARPGTLELSASFGDSRTPPGIVHSNTARLAVTPPEGDDAAALEWLRKRALLPYLGYVRFARTSVGDERILGLREFVERHPRSVYSPYARFAVAQVLFFRKEYEQAMPLLRDVAQTEQKGGVAEDAALLMAECMVLRGEEEDGRRWLSDVIKRYPDTPAADDAQERLKVVEARRQHGRRSR